MIAWLLQHGDRSFHAFYASDLRGDIFAACLTLSGFLYAAYTFIIVHMKSEVYDTEEYKRVFEMHRTANKTLTLYGPLRKLSKRLFRTVIATLIAAVLQFSLGLIPYNWAAVICLLAGAYAIYELARGIQIVNKNLSGWLDAL
jgi:hypothetical protein